MSNRFVADPYTLRNKGSEIIDKSQEFGENINKIYQTVNEMINSNYLDPAARAIAQEIETYRDDLDKMTKVIAEYGNFCLTASSKVIKNQDNIISRL